MVELNEERQEIVLTELEARVRLPLVSSSPSRLAILKTEQTFILYFIG